MKDIYKRASSLTTWLGPSTHDSPLAFQTFRRFHDAMQGKFTREQLANRPSVPRGMTPRQQAKSAAPPVAPSTPPMMRQSSYDADATAGDFSDAGFYDDDESTVDDYRGESVGGR